MTTTEPEISLGEDQHQKRGNQRNLVLASGSPQRKQLLARLGLSFKVAPAKRPEIADFTLGIKTAVRTIALNKAREVAEYHSDSLVIGVDTIVSLDEDVLTKPKTPTQAFEMLSRLSGRTHKVMSAVAVVDGSTLKEHVHVTTSWVRLRRFDTNEIRAYLRACRATEYAGGLDIQGCGSVFVASVRGDFSNVLGIPLRSLSALLSRFGFAIFPEITRRERS